MDLTLSDDQEALVEGLRAFCAGRFPREEIRSLEGVGVTPASWSALTEMGVFSLRLPEAQGGIGLGWVDAVLAFEQLGAALVPGPLVWSQLAVDLRGAAAVGSPVTGLRRDDPFALVPFAGSLQAMVVLDDEGVWWVDAHACAFVSVGAPLDPLTPVWTLAEPLPRGERLAGPDAHHPLRRDGALLSAAQLLGLSTAATDLAVAFAREREQFGRPIGSFQALKHLMADMFVRAEIARAAVYVAAANLDDPDFGDADRAVAAAVLTAREAALANAKTCIQVHGGMGYTWEVDAHLLLKRAYVLVAEWGASQAWCEDVAHALTPGAAR